jgi:thioredoxin 1
VVIVEIYEEMELARQYDIMIMPTQVIFDSNGKEITRHIGVWSREEIINQLKMIGVQ